MGRIGPNWAGLPHAPVSWVVVQKQFHDVVVSTYGRGIYVLDDITPLEQGTASTTDASLHVFTPRTAYRWTQRGRAYVNFSLKSAPRGQAEVQIVDSDGTVVRDLKADAGAGLNR